MTRFKVIGHILFVNLILLSLLSKSRCQQESATDDLYSETPCELHPLSSYKDVYENLWGVGDGNLWWFNSTNLSWSLLPLPNGSSVTDFWRVACGDPKRYVSLLSSSGALVLHLPWQHWQQVDADELESKNIDPSSTWCRSGVLYATDVTKTIIYMLDTEEARWTLYSEITLLDADGNDDNTTRSAPSTNGESRTWLMSNGDFVIAETQNSFSRILVSNSSGAVWSELKKKGTEDLWPEFHGQSVTWAEEKDGPTLWFWRSDNATTRVWAFNESDLAWVDHSEATSALPRLDDVLTAWVQNDKLCFLSRTEVCTSQYSASSTVCWSRDETTTPTDQPTTAATSTPSPSPPITTSTVVPTVGKSQTLRPKYISAHTIISKHSLLAALQSEIDGPDASDEIPITAVVPAKHPGWHQHTSVFGSVIFFGTSLTIFGMVFTFWCMRRCVHFPKEALLLRDPPSVRYTAIPDNVPFDARGHPATAYTVIPDSIA